MGKIETKQWRLGGAAVTVGLMLSGCGGGGVASTPTPAYTKLSNLSGNQTFQSAGIHFTFANSQPSGYSSQKYGSGVVIAYTAASDSYTLTAPDGTTATFSSSGSPPPLAPPPPPNTTILYSGSDRFSATIPTINGVTLSYTSIGDWNSIQNGIQSNYYLIFGVPTIASDMPKSGTASYQTSIVGTASRGTTTPYNLQPNSTADFSANFGAGTVSTTLNLAGVTSTNPAPTSFGSYSGTGTITAGSPGFSGTLASVAGNSTSATGEFSGAFFGPQAMEMGYAWYLGSGLGGFSAQGTAVGTK